MYSTNKMEKLPYSELTSFNAGKEQVLYKNPEYDGMTDDQKKSIHSIYHDRLKSWYPSNHYSTIARRFNMNKDIWNGVIVKNIEDFMKALMDKSYINIMEIKETIGTNGYPYYIIKYIDQELN
jgi:hypothetical protein